MRTLHRLLRQDTNTQCYRQCVQIKEDEMGGNCSTQGGDDKCTNILLRKSEEITMKT